MLNSLDHASVRNKKICGSNEICIKNSKAAYQQTLSAMLFFILFFDSLLLSHSLNVLIVGGSGRVGLSTLNELRKLATTELLTSSLPITFTIGCRTKSSFNRAKARKPASVGDASFIPCDVTDPSSLNRACANMDLVIHTAGPFQGRKTPAVLDAAILASSSYLDVCDETSLVSLVKNSPKYSSIKNNNITGVVSAGIWPGVSAIMAREAESLLPDRKADRIEFSFFTSGTGNAGPTIVSATFLLLVTPVVEYVNNARKLRVPWSGEKLVDFGGDAGLRKVRLLDCPDVETVHKSLDIPNVVSRFATAPEFWNLLFGASQKILPDWLLADREKMQGLALFSEPIVRSVDKLVGARNVMKVDAYSKDGSVVTLIHDHPDLEVAVEPLPAFRRPDSTYRSVTVAEHLGARLIGPKRHAPSTGTSTLSDRTI